MNGSPADETDVLRQLLISSGTNIERKIFVNRTTALESNTPIQVRVNDFRKSYPMLEEETIADYLLKNATSHPFEEIFLQLPCVTLKSREECYAFVKETCALARARKGEPLGYFDVSRVGLNQRTDQAILQVGFVSEPSMGMGRLHILGKQNEVWNQVETDIVWVA